jgi:glutamyl-tRNA synthetase
MPPRVRVAPSPTGDPHVGTAYIALFNYAFAQRHGGKFVLRIEDTDQTRSTRSSETAIFEALQWLGLAWDEGPDVGGPHGPYRQSERTDKYRAAAEQLLQSGAAYRCFCTKARLDELREQQKGTAKQGYDGHCRSVAADESQRRAAAGEAHVVRLRVPEGGETIVHDQLRDGPIAFSHAEIDDQVLMKSDGFPTYHLANVVDDHDMGITHVIRGEDWLTSTPKHVLMYQAFGWDAPLFYHVGLLRNPDGSKLSKRKNPVSIDHYRALGFMPSTFLNFLATLGYSMPDGQERFALADLVAGFELSRLQTGGPKFDLRKLEAFSGDDIRALDASALYDELQARVLSEDRLRAMIPLVRERITRLDDFVPYASFLFGASVDYAPVADKLVPKKRTAKETVAVLKDWLMAIETDPRARAFDVAGLEEFSREFCDKAQWKPKELFAVLRVAACGRTAAPPLFDTLALLGKDRVRLRLRDAIDFLKALPAS